MRFRFVRHRLLALAVCMCVSLFTVAQARAIDPPPSEYPQPGRIVVVANILGEFDLFMEVLRNANLVDNKNNWIGGKAHLVILGNFVGFGEGVRQIIDTIRSLEKQASEANGMVHTILGVNEINMLHRDIAHINPVNYEDLATEDSPAKIDQMIERGALEMIARLPSDRSPESSRSEYRNYAGRFLMPGSVEFLEMIAPGAELGDWLRSRNIVIRIGDYLFSSGGLNLQYAQKPLDEINTAERASLATESLLLKGDMITTHPVWWRYFVSRGGGDMQAIIDATLYIANARTQVVGLTSNASPTHMGFHGRVFFVDSGMQAYQLGAVNRVLSALDIVGREFTLIYDKQRIQSMTPPPPPPAPTAKDLRHFARD